MTIDEVSKLVQMAFYGVTATVAVIGLNAWRAQMIGKQTYEVAKSVVAGAYRVRDSIKRCQSAFMSANEWAERTPVPGESDQQRHADESYFAYVRRFNKVIEAIEAWYPAIVEAEAIFGAEAKHKAEALTAVASKLNAAITVYHKLMYRGKVTAQHDQYFNIIYGINEFNMPDLQQDGEPPNDNNFQREFDAAVKDIEIYFMLHMNQKAIEV
ncbi:hypothetical protein OR1_00378 [Geobacter sp. OR-1]|uniref:hypothetical protein n=1 Tax=Geobacter sp. OR-1 TaxID=1266765 RepID=UPI0005442943|nr:hypothetical protein [Geobacter sp. OR-1]GAM08107.1 hypothetical protein OR1_00378 [Geobacter sp. OR-1]